MQPLEQILSATPVYRDLMGAAARRNPSHCLVLEVQDPSLGRAVVSTWLATLYCDRPGEGGVPCGTCRNCSQLRAGSHLGVVHVEPDGNTLRVEQVREDILGRIGEKVPGGLHQVFVLHRAEGLNEESGNALLKVIEEPPGKVVFLLLTEDRNGLLGTIRSRAQERVLSLPGLGQVLGTCDLGGDRARGAAALLTAGLAPGVVEALVGGWPGSLPGEDLGTLASEGFEALEDAQVLRDPRPTAHSPSRAEALFRAALEMLTSPGSWRDHARSAHAWVDACSDAAKKRAKAIRGRLQDEFGSGYQHPVLKREVAFARSAATRATEDLLRALTACLASALRQRSGHEPFGLVALYPELGELAATPSAVLLRQARRVRSARSPLLGNQNARLLLEELFLDLDEGAALGGAARVPPMPTSSRAHSNGGGPWPR